MESMKTSLSSGNDPSLSAETIKWEINVIMKGDKFVALVTDPHIASHSYLTALRVK
jgi:hypothetical protein